MKTPKEREEEAEAKRKILEKIFKENLAPALSLGKEQKDPLEKLKDIKRRGGNLKS